MKISDIMDSIVESMEQARSEEQSVGLLRSGQISGRMMTIAEEVQQELDEDFLEECDESFREAA